MRHPLKLVIAVSTTLLLAVAVAGCSLREAPVISTDGPIALSERNLLFIASGLMLLVLIPVWIMAAWIPWKYRSTNRKADYRPDWSYSAALDVLIWGVPALIVFALGVLLFMYSHRLDPYRPLASSAPPLRVEAVALDWKWLFIYPQQGIAAVNKLVIPVERPVSLRITSDTVMDSIYIPGLVGQIYAMAGMQTRLHFKADKPRHLVGLNNQYSGEKFPDQRFAVDAVTAGAFADWIAKARKSHLRLDHAAYAELATTRGASPVLIYAGIAPHLFRSIIEKYSARVGNAPALQVTQ